MEKVYLLLRNNSEAGPYTYEELLQQNLLPTDLIWIEGVSTAWMQPADLQKSLVVEAALLESNQKDTAKAIVEAKPEVPWYQKRRSPEAELEAKAIALKQQVQAETTAHKRTSLQSVTLKKTKYNPVVFQEEESPLLLEIHRGNKKSVTLPQLIAAGVITALVATGWYNRDQLTLVRPQASVISQAASPVVFQVIQPPAPKAAAIQVLDTTTAHTALLPALEKPVTSKAATQKQPLPKTELQSPAVATPAQQDVPSAETRVKEEKTIVADPPVLQKKEVMETKNQPDATTETAIAEPAKKKGLGQALKKIFKKKKKTEESVEQE